MKTEATTVNSKKLIFTPAQYEDPALPEIWMDSFSVSGQTSNSPCSSSAK